MPPSKIKGLVWSLLWLGLLSGYSGFSQKSKTTGSPVAVAEAEIAAGKLDRAEQTLWAVLSADPNKPDALILLGIIRGRQKRYPEAEALLRRAIQLDTNSAAAHRNLA